MKYQNANDILPKELIRQLQKYASGHLIYIPKPKETHHRWGEVSGSRAYLSERNVAIKDKFKSGYDLASLSKEFCLSIDNI